MTNERRMFAFLVVAAVASVANVVVLVVKAAAS